MGKNVYAVTPAPLKDALVNDIPDVKYSTRCSKRSHTLEYNKELFAERGFLYADPDFVKIFTIPVVSGNPLSALEEPFNLFITREMAQKYFGNDNPIGKVIKADNKYLFTVAGILENVPSNSHLDFDFLTGFTTLYSTRGGRANVETWKNFSYTTYVQLSENARLDNVYLKLGDFGKKYLSDQEIFAGIEWILQPLKDIHLSGNANFDIARNSDIKYLYLISTIGIFILLIACFNYMNIAMARSYNRGREIGILKVAGSSKSSLILQFLTESVILSFLGLILALGLVLAILPVFSHFTDRPLNFMMIFKFSTLIRIIILTFVVGLIAGFYPAIHLSSLSPINLIKEDFKNFDGKRRMLNLRNMIVILQYCISLVALISTFTIVRQLSFIRNADLGFDKENILTILLNDPLLRKKPDFLMSEIRKNPTIIDITTSSDLPYAIYSASFAAWEGKNAETRESVFNAGIGNNFIEFYKLKVISGRGYSDDFPSDSVNSIIISHETSKIAGWSSPENKKFGFKQEKLKSVIGEIKDFYFQSLHLAVEPLALLPIGSDEFPEVRYVSVRANPENLKEAKLSIEKKLKELSPDYLNPVSSMSDNIDSLYASDKKTGTILIFSTIIAVILTCFGQYSLSSYTTKERTKEMVIRKVMGSKPSGIMIMMAGEISKWILVAIIFAWPVAYLLMNKWLQNFAYHIKIGAGVFIYSLVITVLISIIAISYHLIQLSQVNPAERIRHE
jgi:putative ABC transport system permease protein